MPNLVLKCKKIYKVELKQEKITLQPLLGRCLCVDSSSALWIYDEITARGVSLYCT